jgi:predicted site-specific integrase-resolvase
MKLSHWAKQQGIAYQTAWRWYKAGLLPVKAFQSPSGTILVEPSISSSSDTSAWIYARVSSPEKKGDLDRQAERCVEFCRSRGWNIQKIIKEVASGMNDNRPKLKTLLKANPSRIVIEHKDRLTRFGFGYFETLLPMLGCELVVINRDVEEKDDLIKDLIAIISSLACRIYGLRRGRKKASEVKGILLCEEPAE